MPYGELMKVSFADPDLDRLETDQRFNAGRPENVVRAYRMRMQAIRAAIDERDLRNKRSFRLEKLKGKRQHQHSMRLNAKMRLILEFVEDRGEKVVRVVGIEDYH